MKLNRVEKVKSEMKRLKSAISVLESTAWPRGNQPLETGAVRRASMDLTRALADLRKSDYDKLPGER